MSVVLHTDKPITLAQFSRLSTVFYVSFEYLNAHVHASFHGKCCSWLTWLQNLVGSRIRPDPI